MAFYRMKGGSQAVGPSANAVIALCAATGLDATRRRSPAGEPLVTAMVQMVVLPAGGEGGG